VEKVYRYGVITMLIAFLLFAGGFIAGRASMGRQSDGSSAEYRYQISKVIGYEREYLNRERSRLSDEGRRIRAERARLDKERSLYIGDRKDLSELNRILTEVREVTKVE